MEYICFAKKEFGVIKNELEEQIMRHFIIRLILGIILLIVAVVSGVKSNMTNVILYAVLGILFLISAYTLWKKEKKDKDNRG